MAVNPFNLNSLKGRIAEQLIQDLFINSGYNIFNYGLERLHPGLSKSIRMNNHTTSKALRFMPDFVVQSNLTGELFYMEVKFRANGTFFFDEKYQDYPYKNAWFIVVSPMKIQCIHYKRLVHGFGITPKTSYSLLKVKSFHVDANLHNEYEDYAKRIYSDFKPSPLDDKRSKALPISTR